MRQRSVTAAAGGFPAALSVAASVAVAAAALLTAPVAPRAQEAPAGPEDEATEIPPQAERIRAIPLFTYEREGDRKTLRVLDLVLLRLLEVGGGEEGYRRVSLLDTPILSLFRHRSEGATRETRLFDARLFALLRREQEGADRSAFHILKLPLLGSLFAHEREPGLERWRFLFAFRREVKN